MVRRRFTYANVVATMALVFAMSGGALAASHYLINSTRQINPRVLKSLRGRRGPETLPAGDTEYGTIGAEAQVGEDVEVAANAQLAFPAPVALNNAHVIVSPKPSAHCPGSAAAPSADAGYVCIYPYFESDPATGYVWGEKQSKYGFQMSFRSSNASDAVFANWAYKAP